MSKALLTFPAVGEAKEWHLTPAVVADLAAAYPTLDVLAECRKALAWVQAKPANRKTARGYRAFITAWLSRTIDNPRGAARFGTTPDATDKPSIWDRLEGMK